ncbi:ATP-grasp domain-containing protein [Paractinoplanes durhamensis]|uniref:ATP-grasp domain-containing protein n=1 Tax=Paractinoplanes durhamensis TaxID=113563 RepID=A0ABQ3Z0F6_9ACTN|nr:ATP-grasp domain-containing protein [Actinoplanes durhamensis]
MSTSTTAEATRESSRVALITCHLFPSLWDDDFPLRDALRARGVTVDVVRWDDMAADWPSYDAAILRSPWDYVARRDDFVAWAYKVPRLLNPAPVVEWNTDKRYLHELAAAGVPITPTTYVGPGEVWNPPSDGEWVVKPTISAGSQDTGRYALPAQLAAAEAHVARLTAAGRTAMIQPYLSAVDTAGETALLYFPDASGKLTFSHAARKGPMLTATGGGAIDPGSEDISARTPSPDELETASKVLAAIPSRFPNLLYARIDVIPGPDGTPLLVELELTEPSLFLLTAPSAATRLAEAIIARL